MVSDPPIERALSGDGPAATELVARLRPIIRRGVARVLVDEGGGSRRNLAPEIEDLTQEVLLALFARHGRILKTWVPERGLAFDRFVGLVARRRALSIVHSRRRNPFHGQPTDPADLETHPYASVRRDALASTELREALEQITAALHERLSPMGVDMFRRLFVEEQSVSHISATTGLTVDSVYQWRTRIRKLAIALRRSNARTS